MTNLHIRHGNLIMLRTKISDSRSEKAKLSKDKKDAPVLRLLHGCEKLGPHHGFGGNRRGDPRLIHGKQNWFLIYGRLPQRSSSIKADAIRLHHVAKTVEIIRWEMGLVRCSFLELTYRNIDLICQANSGCHLSRPRPRDLLRGGRAGADGYAGRFAQ
jgi:hypothetical protein